MRPVRIDYRWPGPDSPRRQRLDGVVLIVFTAVMGTAAVVVGYAAWVSGVDRTLNGSLCVVLPIGAAIAWWTISIRTFYKGWRARGCREVRGVVVHREVQQFWTVATEGGPSTPFDLWFLAVDDGTADALDGWEVPHEVHRALPEGTVVDATVAGDGSYVYSIGPASS